MWLAPSPWLTLLFQGSTAFPKPIPFTHRSLLQTVRAPYFGERDLTDSVSSLHCMPVFHAIGIIMTFETVGASSANEPASDLCTTDRRN